MNKKKYTAHLISSFLLITFILFACGKKPNPITQISPTRTNSSILKPTLIIYTATPLRTETAPITPVPLQRLQLTYSIRQNGVDKIYAIPVECPNNASPCMGEPEFMFEFNAPIYNLNWSPDGKQVVFEAIGIGGKDDVFIADWNGNNLKNITNSPEFEGAPIWSPDGKRIGYISCISYIGCKFVSFNPDGSDLIVLLSKLGDVANTAVWSPDETQLLFSGSITEPFTQIYLSNLDGTGLVKLTDDNTEHYSPVFSPKGDWIAFAQDHNPEEVDWSDIFLIHPDGSDETNLTNGLTTFQADIKWSPIGNWIAFLGIIDEKHDIYIIHPDGKDFIKVTDIDGNIGTPAWRLSYDP